VQHVWSELVLCLKRFADAQLERLDGRKYFDALHMDGFSDGP